MTKKIMVIDDEPELVNMMVRSLVGHGYLVCVAYEGFDAIKVAHEEKPDLILLDYRMPAGSGLSVFQGLKMSEFTSRIPVIFVTAYPLDDVKKKALDMGAAAYILKPFEMKDLIAKIEEVLPQK
jgi:two-component system phosphate regulon response regulator PhoB